MSGPDERDVVALVDRAFATVKTHGDNSTAYLLVVFAALAGAAPEVAKYVLDHADKVAATWGADDNHRYKEPTDD